MIAVLGSFRFPPEAVARARPLMQAVVEATLAEPGCHAYSYAEDVTEPGLFRVTELWDSRAALSGHFETRHMGCPRRLERFVQGAAAFGAASEECDWIECPRWRVGCL